MFNLKKISVKKLLFKNKFNFKMTIKKNFILLLKLI